MIERGATITWEAWDQRYNPNLDWNHAWGAAPANLLPRYVAGARAIAPGWQRAQIKPHPAGLAACRAKIPTPHGPLFVDWRHGLDFDLRFTAPAGIETELSLPFVADPVVRIDGWRWRFASWPIGSRSTGRGKAATTSSLKVGEISCRS